MKSQRTLVFRARLSRATHASLEAFLEEMRHLWNAALEERIDAWRKAGMSISWVDQFKSLTEIRRALPGYARCSAEAQRSILKRLDGAFQGFYRRLAKGHTAGFPRFRSKRRRIRSFEIPAPKIYRKGRWNTVSVKGIGVFRFADPQGRLGQVSQAKRLRIVKTPIRVYVQLVVERVVPEAADRRAPVGIDVGVRYRAALSTGHKVPGRRIDRSELLRRQRILSRAKPGSKGRCKKREALARTWQRTRERERGMLHELTAKLVREHGARLYVERLDIRKMLRTRRFARSIAEQNWGTFVSLLTYKAEEAGGWVRKVSPQYTSQTCSECGARPKKPLTLAVRTYRCGFCGHVQDRDVNAARNILQAGLRLRQPGGTSPRAPGGVAGCSGEQPGAGRKAGHRVTAQNGTGRRAAQAVNLPI